MKLRYCERCGKPVLNDIYCQDCEKIVAEENASKEKKNKYVFLIIILLFAYFIRSNIAAITRREEIIQSKNLIKTGWGKLVPLLKDAPQNIRALVFAPVKSPILLIIRMVFFAIIFLLFAIGLYFVIFMGGKK